jgi:hypothetical protein
MSRLTSSKLSKECRVYLFTSIDLDLLRFAALFGQLWNNNSQQPIRKTGFHAIRINLSGKCKGTHKLPDPSFA